MNNTNTMNNVIYIQTFFGIYVDKIFVQNVMNNCDKKKFYFEKTRKETCKCDKTEICNNCEIYNFCEGITNILDINNINLEFIFESDNERIFIFIGTRFKNKHTVHFYSTSFINNGDIENIMNMEKSYYNAVALFENKFNVVFPKIKPSLTNVLRIN